MPYFLMSVCIGGALYGLVALMQWDFFSVQEIIDPKGYYQPWFYMSVALLGVSVLLSIYLILRKRMVDATGILTASLIYLFATFYSAFLYFNHREFYEQFNGLKWKHKERSLKMAREIRDQDLLENLNQQQVIRKLGIPDDSTRGRMTYYLDDDFIDCDLEVILDKGKVTKTVISCDVF